MQQPKDGDFVAYIEALQRESAARLAQQDITVDAAFGTKGSADSFQEKAAPPGVPEAGRPPTSFTHRDRDSKLVKSVVAGVIGVAFLLSWLGDGGVFSFVIGAVLLAYALPRLLGAFRSRQPADNKALIDLAFGRPRPGATENGK